MSELRQYHPSFRVFQLKQSQNDWIFIGDTPKDFAILQSEPKMQQVFGKNVKLSLPESYHSADATKGNILVFMGVSTNLTIDDFKELLEFNNITHAEAERTRRSFRGGFICQKTGIIFKAEEFRTTPSILQCLKCQGFGHKVPNCNKKPKCVVCGESHSYKNCPNKDKRKPKCANCRQLQRLSCLQGSSLQAACSPKTSFILLHPKTSFTSTPQQHI